MSKALTPAEFKARVTRHLRAALKLVPSTVPDDVFDPVVTPLMDELQELDQLLYGLGREERIRDDEERARERRLAAKAVRPDLETILIRLDQRAQKLAEMAGADDNVARIVAPISALLFVTAAVQLLETVPAAAYTDPVLGADQQGTDPTVRGIFELMRQRVAS